MKSVRVLPLFLLAFLLSACGTNGCYTLTLITNGEHQLAQDIQGDLIILGGEASLIEGVTLSGNAHLLLGKLTIDGKVSGDVNFLNGDLTLGKAAVIRGDLNMGGGSYHSSQSSMIEGKVNTGAGIPLPDMPVRKRSMGISFWVRALAYGFISGLAAAGLVRYFQGGIGHIREAITHHSLACTAIGILTGIVGISLLVTMAYTILLIPISLLGIVVLGVGVFLGWVGLGSELGRFLFRFSKRPFKPSQAAFIGMLIFTLGTELLASLPAIGSLLSLTMVFIGLGAVMLTRFGLRRFVPTTEENLPN